MTMAARAVPGPFANGMGSESAIPLTGMPVFMRLRRGKLKLGRLTRILTLEAR
jgi:hypothetical protein